MYIYPKNKKREELNISVLLNRCFKIFAIYTQWKVFVNIFQKVLGDFLQSSVQFSKQLRTIP